MRTQADSFNSGRWRVPLAAFGIACLGVFGAICPTVGAGESAGAEMESEIKPRFELRVPSLRHLQTELMRSRSRALVTAARRMLIEAGQASAEGVKVDEFGTLLSLMTDWPDTSIEAATFAPDLEGRPRWVIAVDWPLPDAHQRVRTLLDHEASSTMFEGVTLEADGDDGFVVRVSGDPLAYLHAEGEKRSSLSSHAGLRLPSLSPALSAEDGRSEAGPIVVARLNLTKTESDSGATFLSSFSAVTALDYRASVREDHQWDETIRVHWPPISGMGAKALFDRVNQSFFVPEAALGAAVVNMPIAAGMLDGMAGLGPQVVMDQPGEVEFVGEAMAGPIVTHVESDVCFTVLPGTGFLPAPDLAIQVRTKKADRLIEALREEIERINELFVEREQPEPWRELKVRGRDVFWSDPPSAPRGVMVPFVMRPVLFTTTERDSKDRERTFLVLGMTTTDPVGFVERWLNYPRTREFKHLPTETKTNGQLWVRWRGVYGLISPYVNLALSGAGIDALIPSASSMNDDLADGLLTIQLKYSGLTASHVGPLPAGAVVLPSMFAGSLAPQGSGASDLARERLASQRLKLLHHHCVLFKKDLGRWPAEIGELDGYIDFAGHPELLHLQLSAKKRWSRMFEGLTKAAQPDDEEDEDDFDRSAIKTELYVIDWSRDRWSLGFKEGTFEHLERLYIDQDGEIHRVVRVQPIAADEPESKPELKPVDETLRGNEEPPVGTDEDDEKE